MLILATSICAVGALFLIGLGVYAERIETHGDSNRNVLKLARRHPK